MSSGTARRPIKVSVTYCAECGYEPQTLELVRELMLAHGTDLASIEIIPWYEGSFDVMVDGELVHSMYRDGGFPDPKDVVAAVRARRQTPSTPRDA